MASCAQCGSIILMGGIREGTLLFCNEACHKDGQIVAAARKIPAERVERKLTEVWRGQCPRCGGAGPNDVYYFHQIYSIFLFSRWSRERQICCRACGSSGQLRGLLFSLVFGWWGFPWGIIMTPIQIFRNIRGLGSPPDASRPSAALRSLVSIQIAAAEGALQAANPRGTGAQGGSPVPAESSQRPMGHDSRKTARKEGDIPVRSDSLKVFYICLPIAMIVLPRLIPKFFFWTAMIPYFIWRPDRPTRARKWLLHASIAMGLCILFSWVPLWDFLASLVPR